jgi:hypothetical protein
MRRLSLLAFGLLGCSGLEGAVRDRMAADTGCSADDVHVSRLPASAYRAVGCGRTATYVCTLPDGVIACSRESGPEAVVQVPPDR